MSKKFNNSTLASIEDNVRRLEAERNQDFIKKLNAATERARENAERAAHEAYIKKLEEGIARMKAELSAGYVDKVRYKKVASSNPKTARKCNALKKKKMRERFSIIDREYYLQLQAWCFDGWEDIQEGMEFDKTRYIKVYKK